MIVCFSLIAAISVCTIQLPQEYVPMSMPTAVVNKPITSTARMGSIIHSYSENYSVAPQPTVAKPYVAQPVMTHKPSMVYSYGGGMRSNMGNAYTSPVVTSAAPSVVSTPVHVGAVRPSRVASPAVSHKPTMRRAQYQTPVATAVAKPTSRYQTVNTISGPVIATNSLSLGYEAAASYMTPAVYRAPGSGIDNALNNWLLYGSGSGALVSGDATTGYYYDMATLQELFNQMQANGDMPGMTWEQFLDWFNDGSQNRHFMPVGDAWWLVALLALGYGILVYRKHKRQTMITA